jgi:hypothetical protein
MAGAFFYAAPMELNSGWVGNYKDASPTGFAPRSLPGRGTGGKLKPGREWLGFFLGLLFQAVELLAGGGRDGYVIICAITIH